MCLEVKKFKHLYNPFTGNPIPRKLLFDKTVWKVLRVENGNGKVVTPFMRAKLNFDSNGRCESRVFTKEQFSDLWHKTQKSSCAFHAFLDYNKAKEVATELYAITTKPIVCKAVIPKGSYVFYGNNKDICCNRMVVYREEY